MFGKPVADYIAFQKWFLVATAAVGIARLGVSVAGTPDSTATWLSMNAVIWSAAVYYGVAVHTSGFGSYKQLLPLGFFNVAILHVVAVAGILLSIAGFPNILAAPEYGGANPWLHLLAHLTIGMIAAPLVLWALSSLVLRITKSVARRPVAT